jgi:hypothetical protein
MKNSIVLALLFMILCSTMSAQKDYKFMTKPEIQMDVPLAPMTMFRFTNEEPCLFKFKTIVDGKEVTILKYSVIVKEGNADIEKIPGTEGEYMVTPHCKPDSMWLRLSIYYSSPGYRILMPVPKEGVDRLWDSDRKLIMQNVKSWKPIADLNEEVCIEQMKIQVLRQGIHNPTK